MTREKFLKNINNLGPKENWDQSLKSLWWEKRGEWGRAHSIAQEINSEEGSAIHAYLHRKEGVLWNADYWYRRARRSRPSCTLDQEWDQLLDEMLFKYPFSEN